MTAQNKNSSTTPGYGYNSKSQRYYDLESGRFVTAKAVREAVDSVITSEQANLQQTSQRLLDGSISLAAWQTDIASSLKALHVAQGVAANGGFANMSQADYGYLGSLIKKQYEFLRDFAGDIASGKQKLDGTLLTRTGLYSQAARGTYEDAKRRANENAGQEEEKRILGPADHCEDCLSAASQGWQPIGTLPRIGDSVCRVNCRCSFEYQ